MKSELAQVICSCGRTHLVVADYIVATQGDVIRDSDVINNASAANVPLWKSAAPPHQFLWDTPTLEMVANRINARVGG